MSALVKGWMAAGMACLALCGLPAAAAASGAAWTTYHHDALRSGVDPDSTSPLPPRQVWQTGALDATVWGQPLVYGSRVYVATENDTVYALSASTGAVVWKKHLATPVDASQLCNGDIDPTVGITSTPVIDPSTGRIYVVADTETNDDPATIAHQMYALNLGSGSVAVGPIRVDPPDAPSGDTPANRLQRASLALDAGKLIIGYGGNDGDCNYYHGWLVAAPANGQGSLRDYEVDSQPGDSEGAIWGAGNAPAIDSQGHIWVSTGNGVSRGFDFSESVIELDSNLHRLQWWAPSDWQNLDNSDTDLGSVMPLLLPGNLLFQIGKGGTGYLLSQAKLGGTGGKPAYQASICGGSWGGGIYHDGVIYVACGIGGPDGLYALALNVGARTFSPLGSWTVNPNAIAPPIFAGGLVWSASYLDGVLYGLDPHTGTTRFSTDLGGFEHFTSPSAGGGRLFVANQDQSVANADQITAFQVAKPPPPPPAISQLRVRSVARKLRLALKLSETAWLTVVVSRLVPGRVVGGRCRVGARHGRRCRALRRKLSLELLARAGLDRLRPRMRRLPAGRYILRVIATNAIGERSPPRHAVFTVRRR